MEHSGAVRIDFSKDKGLRPLLKFFAHLFNEQIVREIYPDLFFEWVGIDAMSEKDKIELTTKKMQNGTLTVNEVRAMDDLDPIKANWANAPVNPTLMQVYVADLNYQREQEAQEKAQAAGGGAPGGMPGMPPGAPGMPPGAPGGAPEGAPGMPPGAPGMPPGGGPQAPGEEPGGTPGALPELPMDFPPGGVKPTEMPGEGAGAPKEMREPSPEDTGVEMPIKKPAPKEKVTGEFEEAREDEKKRGAAKREREHLGMNVYKSQEGDFEVEFELE